jgi:hypothetical protein
VRARRPALLVAQVDQLTLHANVASARGLEGENPAGLPAGFHRSSIRLDRCGRGISLPRWQRDHPAVVAPFGQLAEIAQHLQCLFVAIGQMREDLGGDPAQMGVIWDHMHSPGVPHRAASGHGIRPHPGMASGMPRDGKCKGWPKAVADRAAAAPPCRGNHRLRTAPTGRLSPCHTYEGKRAPSRRSSG